MCVAFSEKPTSRNHNIALKLQRRRIHILFTMTTANANAPETIQLGNGAQFWVYLSPQNDTSKMITTWKVTFSQGNWSGTISSDNPTQQLQTPNLSGIFDIKVELLSGSTGGWREIPAQDGSRNQIGCNSNCSSMVGIVADSTNPPIGAINAHFWTTWDALCRRA